MTERKGELKTFGAKCKTFAKAASDARQKQAQQEEQKKELTIDERLENVATNASTLLNEHANAINAISMWIAENDKKVAQCGNVLDWAIKEQQKKQRLAERKAEYKRSKK
jgi:DNA topoisomerase VI subunit B